MGHTSFQYKGKTITVSWEGKPSREAIQYAARFLADKIEEIHRKRIMQQKAAG